MLSLEKCRELIDESGQFSDKQILDIRDKLYALAELALDCYMDEKYGKKLLADQQIQLKTTTKEELQKAFVDALQEEHDLEALK